VTRRDLADVDARRVSPWHTPRQPGPHADPAAWERWERACERQAEVLDGLAEARLEPEPVRRGSPDAWRRPLMAPVEREVRPLAAQDPRQLGLFRAVAREEAA
jgi:hypothetical protein